MRHWLCPLAALLVLGAGCSPGERPDGSPVAAVRPGEEGAELTMDLPDTAGAWTRPDRPRRIDASSIFSYMNGAGELYLGYRFDHLDVYEYTAADRDPILVELYWMQTSDDAFGLLANDWGGEPIRLKEDAGAEPPREPVPASRALYGGGLLRVWSDVLYARVLATRETPDSREQVLALGRAIAAGRPLASRPSLLRALPERVGEAFAIKRDRVWFLRSPLVLSSAYYLGTENLLELSLDTEAVVAPYDPSGRGGAQSPARDAAPRPHLLLVRYPDDGAARRALDRFGRTYLQAAPSALGSPGGLAGVHRIEQGWVGCRLQGRLLGIVLDAPDETTARTFLEAITIGLGDRTS